MCGRFNQTAEDYVDDSIAKHTAKLTRIHRKKVANISAGMLAVIMTNDGWIEAEFGYRPTWDPKKLFLNARAEGKGNVANNDKGWEVGIDSMASFKKSFLHQRCFIPVDSFIEGPEKEKLNKPYLIKRNNGFTMFLGGIYNQYTKEDGTKEYSFAILTIPAIEICRKIGHHRSPFIIDPEDVGDWMDEKQDLISLKQMLRSGSFLYDAMATPLNPAKIKSGSMHEPEILEPVGDPIKAFFSVEGEPVDAFDED